MRETFETLSALGEHLRLCQARRRGGVSFRLMGQRTDAQLHQALDRMLPMVQRSSRRVWRERGGHAVTMTLHYRDGVRLADAWRRGDIACLTAEERLALLTAQEIARTQADLQAMAAQLARQVSYENPRRGSARYGRIVSGITALNEGRANCQGISDAIYLIGTVAGYAMGYQQGHNPQGEHLWNTVALNGACYALDVTAEVGRDAPVCPLMDGKVCWERGLRWENWAESCRLADVRKNPADSAKSPYTSAERCGIIK